jgi:hypothetical protein
MSKLPTGKIAAHNLLRNYSMMLGLYRPSGGPASQFQCTLSGIGIPPTCRFSLFLSLALVTALLSGCTKGEDAPAAQLTPRYSIPRYITYSFTVENKSAHAVQGAELWAFAPLRQTSTQRCDRIEASQPHDILTDELGNQVLHFNIQTIPPYGSKIIRINAHLSLSNPPSRMESGDLQNFLRPETYVQSDRREILSLALEFKSQNGASVPQMIYGWVSKHIDSAGYSREVRGALDCLARRKGDCTEQAYLFAALCRAAQIPARVMGGYVCDTDCVLTAEGYHNWSEFHQDMCWYVADPQGKVFMGNSSRYIAMRVLGEPEDPSRDPMDGFQRFRIRGDGLTARMN